jgi:hypothetical protein
MFISIGFSINASISLKFLTPDSYAFLVNSELPASILLFDLLTSDFCFPNLNRLPTIAQPERRRVTCEL